MTSVDLNNNNHYINQNKNNLDNNTLLSPVIKTQQQQNIQNNQTAVTDSIITDQLRIVNIDVDKLDSETLQLPPRYCLRRIVPADLQEIQTLYQEWFPVRYSDAFLQRCFLSMFSMCITDRDNDNIIVGAILMRMSKESNINDTVLNFELLSDRRIGYIVTIGVKSNYRRDKIGTKLLQTAVRYAEMENCKCVYLHVMTSNTTAGHFYENNGFSRLNLVKHYYVINKKFYDAFIYAFYMNGGKPSKSIIKDLWSSFTENIPSWCSCSWFGTYLRYLFQSNRVHDSQETAKYV